MKKRVFSFALAIIMAFGCLTPAFANSEKAETNIDVGDSDLPFILIRGMDFVGLRYKLGTEEEQNCLGEIKVGEIIGVVLKAIGKGLIKRDWNVFADVVCEYAQGLLGLMACDEKGNSKYDVSVKEYPKSLANYPEFNNLSNTDEMGILKRAIEVYGAKNVYYYNYDWRLDPYYHADKINELINTALNDSGKDKVNLVCASMGGIETISYMYKYGYEKLNRVVFLSSTFTGTHVTSDILRGKIDFNGFYVYSYLRKLVSNNKFLGFLMDSLYKTKVIDGLCNFLNNTVAPNIIDETYDKLLADVFGTMPSIWALVLPQYYDECVEYMFGKNKTKYADFIALTKDYQVMASKRDDMLYKAVEDGLSICVVAGYNSACVPVYSGGGSNGDSILEADRMLGKAKVAPLGTTLSDDKNANDKNAKISPDNTVDLTDCLFPENTWAIKNGKHVGCNYGSDMSDFLFSLVNFKGNANVTEFTGYSQFMESNDGTDLIK